MKKMTFISLIILFYFHCEQSTTSPENESESVILPLSVGNYWIGLQDSICIFKFSIDTVYIFNNEEWYSYGTLVLKNESTGLYSAIIEDDSLVQ